jgi:hypothetical protein
MDKNLFFYELEGRGYTFENMTWLGNCFEDDILNMVWEMWCASASREGYRLVPVEPSEDMIMAGCMEHGGYDVIDSKSIYKAMIEAQEQSHD